MGCRSHHRPTVPSDPLACPFIDRCDNSVTSRPRHCHGDDFDECTRYLTQLLQRSTPLSRSAAWPLQAK